jgi:rhamnopyranosyl-N-acetylglucosaminyl-diphospho-decaprenol beta-1,3/1,4-galactofuranosyltransferase
VASVCAVVVTFNRKQQLGACLRSISEAKRTPARIIVVDNASTDGTPAFVEQQFPNVELIRLRTNGGCAGGFKTGILAALKSVHDFVWLMDDDHTAEPDTLAHLLEAAQATGFDFVGPVLLTPGHSDALATRYPDGSGYCSSYADLMSSLASAPFIQRFPTPFNGVLYRADALRMLGPPDDRLFIRGDDLDYWLRMQEGTFTAIIAVRARMHHPSMFHQDFIVLHAFGLVVTAHYTGELLKDYCLFRNRAYCFRKYRSYRILILDIPRYVLFFLITRRGDLRGLLFWAGAYLDGLIGRFGHERRFLHPHLVPG